MVRAPAPQPPAHLAGLQHRSLIRWAGSAWRDRLQAEPQILEDALTAALDLLEGGEGHGPPGSVLPAAAFVVPRPVARSVPTARFAPPPQSRLPAEFVQAVASLDARARASFERAVGGPLLGADTRRAILFVLREPALAAEEPRVPRPSTHRAVESYLGPSGAPSARKSMMQAVLRRLLFGPHIGSAPDDRGPNPNDPFDDLPFHRRIDRYLERPDPMQAALDDPSLTVEDKVALAFMLIIKKYDKRILAQSEKLERLQNGAASGRSTSIDVEALKLSRMVTKQAQMADTLKSVLEKYNQTAKGVTDSIGR